MGNLKTIAGAIILVLVLILAGLAYSTFKTPATASGPITAIPLGTSDTGASGAGATAQSTLTASGATAEPTLATSGTATSEATPTSQVATAAAAAGTSTSSSGEVVLQIAQDQSKARFIIDEVLNGNPNAVEGTTDQVAGEIAIDPNNPSKTRVGTIQVDARTLTTDSGMRNRTIANRILLTNQYEYITYTPTRLVGLPQQATVGQSYTFQIVGNLKIRDVTKEVTFDVTAKAASRTRLEGTAKATIRYADYGINIPQVPQVASVGDQVKLELDFVAVPK
jgi:polyisoprenoid-binding protein YceI